LGIMQDSFATIPGVLDPGLASTDEQSLDLVSGLAIRQPVRARSGFYIDGAGTVLTSLEAVENCGEVVLDNSHPARIIHADTALGFAVLQPGDQIAPLGTAQFQTATPRLQAQVAVAGYPYGGLLSAPSLAFGTLADVRGLNGETEIKRLTVAAQDGDSGGPVFDNGGAVIGMLLPAATGDRVLPADVSFSLHAPAIMASLDAAGITYEATNTIAAMTPERLTRAAADVTVLVSCWE
jgi:S1-C subfamily serine protease